jgi:peptide/nickel transport system ATP-binding protein
MKPLLSVEQLQVWFSTPGGKVPAVDNVSFSLKKGEIFALVGETGCGKSVVGRAIMGLAGENAVVSGMVHFKGKNLLTLSEKELSHLRGSAIALILQNPDQALNPVIPIGRQLMEPLMHHLHMNKFKAGELSKKVLESMGFDDIDGILKKYPFQLSGGMNQRILIAASMLTKPGLIIADEPTSAVDQDLKEKIKDELAGSREKNQTSILLITHDLDLAGGIAHRIGVMYAGELVEINQVSSFMLQPHHPYSMALLNSLPAKGFHLEHQAAGISSSWLLPSRGCRFSPRCPFKKSQCTQAKPAMVPMAGGEVRCLLYV